MNNQRIEAIQQCIKLLKYCENDNDIHTRVHRRILITTYTNLSKREFETCEKTQNTH